MTRMSCTCDRVRKGTPWSDDQCRECWLFWHIAEVNANRGGDGRVIPVPAPPARALPCFHEGPVIESCPSCNRHLAESRHVRACLHPTADRDTCTRAEVGPAVQACATCRDYSAERPGPEPSFVRRFDEANLWPTVVGKRFNTAVIGWGDGYVLATRNGWAGSEVYVGRLDAGFHSLGPPVKLELKHREANYGREDPRLFVHRGRLHVSYIGVVGHAGHVIHTSQLYARLGDDLRAEAVFCPNYEGRADWEKNWQFFEGPDTQLYAVYSVAPHRVLQIDGNRADLVHETPNPLPWAGGDRRGGASPERVGNEWWCFFHDRIHDRTGRRVYRMGLYTFDAEAPFRVRRQIPTPILSARLSDRPADQYAYVTFPCGAVRDGTDWVISTGVHDRWTELHRFDHTDLERRLVSV